MDIVCAGHLVRHPVGGHTWHHLQYLVGFQRLGHRVTYVEEFGWSDSCYDPRRDVMTDDPSAGLDYMGAVFAEAGVTEWCYLAADGTAHGIDRDDLADRCHDADLYLSLSNMNSVAESKLCRRRAVIDTDPVFTQLGSHGVEDVGSYRVRFTYGENVGRPGCGMPTGDLSWLPTRQPIVVDLWPTTQIDPRSPLTTVANWVGYDEARVEGRLFGQKQREFEQYIDLPNELGRDFEIAVNAGPQAIQDLRRGGWRVVSPLAVAASPAAYQSYLGRSAGEFSAAKHAYVDTRCGWFSDRTAAYLASGRPAVVQDTGFSDVLPTGEGLLPFTDRPEATAAVRRLDKDPELHARAARRMAETFFDSSSVLDSLLGAAL